MWLTFTKTSTGVKALIPSSKTVAPPGYYMLFILNGDGVPSVARFIRLH
jgi:hypothetical protein